MDSSYYFERFNLITQKEDKMQFIKNTLLKKSAMEHREYKYALKDVEIITDSKVEYIVGELIKYKSKEERTTFNEQSWDSNAIANNNIITASAPFILELKTNFIAYHPSREFQSPAFRSKFAALFDFLSEQALTVTSIIPITRRTELMDEIKSFDKINYIKIVLTPSNPHPARLWKQIDDLMKENGVDKYTEILQTAKPDKSISLDGLDITQKVGMAAAGYGQAIVMGEKNGQPVRTQTGKAAVVAEVPHDTKPNGLATFFKKIFGDLSSEISNENS
jgi:hypothetical protein